MNRTTKNATAGTALAACMIMGGVTALADDMGTSGSFEVTYAHGGSCKDIQIGDDNWAWSCKGRISAINADGDGVLHNMSGDCVMMGAGDKLSGYCSFVDKDENQIFEQWEGSPDKGVGRLVGGTGKFADISGELEWTWAELPAPEGKFQGTGQKIGTFKLP